MTLIEIARVEEIARRHGISMAKLLRRAEIADATWNRWKNGRRPKPATWKRIERAIKRFLDAEIAALDAAWAEELKERKRLRDREYRRRPEIRARARQPENRERQRSYHKKYKNRPEIKAYRREYQRVYRREYRQRPKVKAKMREYQREYWQRVKARQHADVS